MRHYLGIDIGTYESKGALVDGTGRILATASRPHRMIVPEPGWAEHRPREDWWDDFSAISRELIAEGGVVPTDIGAVAVSAIGPCMLPVDADGEPLMNAVLYGVDTRAAAEIEDLTARIGEEVLIERCGQALTSQSVGPKILWLRRNRPELFARAAKVVTSTTYLVWKLTGRYVLDHYSAINTGPLYLAGKNEWSDALAPDLLPLEKLPELLWTTEIAGGVTAAASAETGLAEGTPVTAGTIDAAAEAVSVGVLEPGDMLLMYGSTVFIIALTAARIRDPRLWYAPWLFPGEHAAAAGLATSGTLSHWFREQFARELDPATAVASLAAEAEASPPGARGLVVLPYFSGERTPIHDPRARGMIFGLDLTHTRGDLYRALFEAIAYATNHILETYEEAGEAPRTLLAAGGGVRNHIWLQATSDVSGRTQTLREKTLGAAYGNAFLAALALGDVRRGDIRTWNPPAHEVAPDPATRDIYRHRYRIFRELYPRTRDLLSR
jgi:xylulokinase